MPLPRSLKVAATASWLLAALVVLVPLASASGTGYNLSFSQGASGVNGAVDLVGLTTSDNGATVLVTLTVSGQVSLSSSSDFYFFYSGGSSSSSATAYVEFDGNVTGLWFSSAAGSYGYGNVAGTITNSGSSLQFQLNKTSLPTSGSFTANAEAYSGSSGSGSASWIGSDFVNGGGSGTCLNANCTSATLGTALAWWVLAAILMVVVIVVIVVVVVVLVVVSRRKRQQPPMMPPMASPPSAPAGGTAPPPPPPPPQ